VALLLLGVGWNFMFVGGTTLLAQSYTPSERAKTQGLAELMRYAATALATLGAGPLLARFGWETLNAAILPVLLVSALVTLRWMWAQRGGRTALAAGLR
jgi:predicted MFS family arabinose efflux permease